MRKFFLMIIFLSLAGAAQAASNPFSGFSVSGDVGADLNSTEVRAQYDHRNLFGGARDGFNSSIEDYDGDHDMTFASNVNADYAFPLCGGWQLGVGGSYFMDSDKVLSSEPYSFSNPNNRADFPRDYIINTRIDPVTHLSVNLKPGYAFNEKLLGFMIVSWHHLRGGISTDTDVNLTNFASPQTTKITDVSEKKTFNGIGLGGGVKLKLNGNWFLTVLGEWVFFEKETLLAAPRILGTNDEITIEQNMEIEPSWVALRMGVGLDF